MTLRRGDVWVADLNPGFGVEIHKKRPVLVISNDTINTNWLRIVIVPFSTQTSQLNPGKVLVKKNVFGLEKDSMILASEIRSIDKIRLLKKIGVLPKDKMEEVEETLKLVLGITPLD